MRGNPVDPALISAITRLGTIGRVLEKLRSHGGNPDNIEAPRVSHDVGTAEALAETA